MSIHARGLRKYRKMNQRQKKKLCSKIIKDWKSVNKHEGLIEWFKTLPDTTFDLGDKIDTDSISCYPGNSNKADKEPLGVLSKRS